MKHLFILLLVLTAVPLALCSQNKDYAKMQETFMAFMGEKLKFTKEEATKLRPLVSRYFSESRKIRHKESDPLVRGATRAKLKIKYRDVFTPIIGEARATRFFAEEQQFIKKVKEELGRRNVKEN